MFIKLISSYFHNKVLEMNHKTIFTRTRRIYRQNIALDCTVLLGCGSGHVYHFIARLFGHICVTMSFFFSLEAGGLCCRFDKPGCFTRCRLYRGVKEPQNSIKAISMQDTVCRFTRGICVTLHPKTQVVTKIRISFCPALTKKGKDFLYSAVLPSIDVTFNTQNYCMGLGFHIRGVLLLLHKICFPNNKCLFLRIWSFFLQVSLWFNKVYVQS